jgi:hypothetical protein
MYADNYSARRSGNYYLSKMNMRKTFSKPKSKRIPILKLNLASRSSTKHKISRSNCERSIIEKWTEYSSCYQVKRRAN